MLLHNKSYAIFTYFQRQNQRVLVCFAIAALSAYFAEMSHMSNSCFWKQNWV